MTCWFILTFFPPLTVPPAIGLAFDSVFFTKSKNILVCELPRLPARDACNDLDAVVDARWVYRLGRVLNPDDKKMMLGSTRSSLIENTSFQSNASWLRQKEVECVQTIEMKTSVASEILRESSSIVKKSK